MVLDAGLASFYHPSLAGRLTANGERYRPAALTCAHRTLPFGTRLRVVNEENGRSVVVRVNDRGPFVKGRVVDLSLAAARHIGLLEPGLARVRLEHVGPDSDLPARARGRSHPKPAPRTSR